MRKKTEVEIKKLRIVITLLVISLAGIISVQIWYLVHAHRVKNETFQRNVNEALEQLAVKIENREAFTFFKKDGVADTQAIQVPAKLLSPEIERPLAENDKKGFDAKDALPSHGKMHKGEYRHSGRMAYYRYHAPPIRNIDSAKISLTDSADDKITLASIKTPQELRCYFKKRMLLNKMALELAMRDKTIAQRMDLSQLDTLISNEFANESIDIPCKFGIINANDNSFVYTSKGADKTELEGSQYKAQLFPMIFS